MGEGSAESELLSKKKAGVRLCYICNVAKAALQRPKTQQQYGLPLKVLSYKSLYGWTMDEIVKEIGLKNNCTFCGVFRRQALDRGASLMKADKIATGHNADDIAETVLLNILRGDIARLSRCTLITTGEDGPIPRCKPFKYSYEKEIVMYAYFKRLDYFSTEYHDQYWISLDQEKISGYPLQQKCLSKGFVSVVVIFPVRNSAKLVCYLMASIEVYQSWASHAIGALTIHTGRRNKCWRQTRSKTIFKIDHVDLWIFEGINFLCIPLLQMGL